MTNNYIVLIFITFCYIFFDSYASDLSCDNVIQLADGLSQAMTDGQDWRFGQTWGANIYNGTIVVVLVSPLDGGYS